MTAHERGEAQLPSPRIASHFPEENGLKVMASFPFTETS